MTAQPWEPRLARLEGAYEQVDRRLTAIDARLETLDRKIDVKIDALEAKVTGKIDALDAKLDRKFDDFTKRTDTTQWRTTWLILTTWITIMLTLFFHKT
jgi:Skp family chaperone for outer membrane proteins